MFEARLDGTRDFGRRSLCKRLAEFHTPLIERIDGPDYTLHEDAVFIERDERTQREWIEPFGKNGVAWPVALENAMRNERRRWSMREGTGRPAQSR